MSQKEKINKLIRWICLIIKMFADSQSPVLMEGLKIRVGPLKQIRRNSQRSTTFYHGWKCSLKLLLTTLSRSPGEETPHSMVLPGQLRPWLWVKCGGNTRSNLSGIFWRRANITKNNKRGPNCPGKNTIMHTMGTLHSPV